MRRALLLALVLPASASAAPFGELPLRPVSGSATCLRATGAPGELVRWTRDGVEVLSVGPAGPVPVATIGLGRLRGCPAAASDPGGAAVIAGATEAGIRISLREPGGTWGAPLTLAAEEPLDPDVAISARGDAVVAWTEYRSNDRAGTRVARRPAGGAFGTAEQLTTGDQSIGAVVGMTGAGEAIVLAGAEREVRITSAPMGTPLPAARRLVRSAGSSRFDLAVAADGRALAAVPARDGLILFEREPGGEFVRRPAIGGAGGSDATVVLREGGAAAVAWGRETGIGVLVRDGPVAFGPPVSITEEAPERPSSAVTVGVPFEAPPYEGQSSVRLTLGADGRALLGWGIERAGVRVATVTSAGRTERYALGGRVRDPTGITPLLLAGGGRALAWTDNNPIFSAPPYAGRLRFALEGAPDAPQAPPPELRAGAPRDRSLRPAQPLFLPVRCSAACDIRAELEGDPANPGASLSRAGTAVLRFDPFGGGIAPRRGPVSVRLRWSSPGGTEDRSRTVRVRLRRLPAPRLPRIEGVHARRLPGGDVEVRWRTDGPALDAYFGVVGTRTKDPEKDLQPAFGSATGGTRRRSFRVRLRDARAVRYVHVSVTQLPGSSRTVSARIS